jgi:hypothetical protein
MAIAMQNVVLAAPSFAALYSKFKWTAISQKDKLTCYTANSKDVVLVGSHELLVGTCLYDYESIKQYNNAIEFVGELDNAQLSADKVSELQNRTKHHQALLQKSIKKLHVNTSFAATTAIKKIKSENPVGYTRYLSSLLQYTSVMERPPNHF